MEIQTIGIVEEERVSMAANTNCEGERSSLLVSDSEAARLLQISPRFVRRHLGRWQSQVGDPLVVRGEEKSRRRAMRSDIAAGHEHVDP